MNLLPFQDDDVNAEVLGLVRRTWGFDSLRPLQTQAIEAELKRRDSLVVLPTGGGKSLCYQVPPLLAERTDIVVSPLISLMKDQVDGLVANGYPAAALHSGQEPGERRESERLIASGRCRLAFVSPERLVTDWFLRTVESLGIRAFAVDEAHCISHWGHDFRPEYRQLGLLKQRFPDTSLHAYTATATERVRQDIVEQLHLRDPTVLVGRFDRPNLAYRLLPRLNTRRQVLEIVQRHRGQAVIVYCISRAETERVAQYLSENGHRVAHYHAGLEPAARRRTQEAFANERLDVVVATVAFGMGIDRSDVRCVIHAAMPKSVEHYQQETGRAGRDGLEAECVLLHSPADALKWQGLLERDANDPAAAAAGRAGALELLEQMRRFCTPGTCRHRRLSEYFGQRYTAPTAEGCGACDVCLGETEGWVDGTREAQIILSCVARVDQRYGMGHVVDVARGANTERIRSLGHDSLSTWGLLRERNRGELMNLTFQLLDQGLLSRSSGEYPVLQLNDASLEVLRGDRAVQLVPVKTRRIKATRGEAESWEGVDRDLFERLRALRTRLARAREVPPYLVFSDASLRDMARRRPQSPDEFLAVHGVGEKKLADFGDTFLAHIRGDTDTVEGSPSLADAAATPDFVPDL